MTQVTKQVVKNERVPGGSIPETVMHYIATHPFWFQDRQTHERDTERIIKMSKVGIAKEDAEDIAWLLWRARMVQGWSAVNRKPTRSWAEAVESAWLKDELFQMCSDKRRAYYAEQEARRKRLEQMMATGLEGDHGDTVDAKAQKSMTRIKQRRQATA
jgi:hypothetical protein